MRVPLVISSEHRPHLGVDTVDRVLDVHAFDALYRRDFRRVVGFVYAMSGSRWGAEELAQEAFLAAHQRWAEVGVLEDPGAWVRRVTMNKAVSVVRRRVAEVKAVAAVSLGRRTLPDRLPSDDDAFWRAVRRLPPGQRQAIALHYAEDFSIDEIAGVMEVHAGTVKVHLRRGRAALSRFLSLELEES